MKSIIFILCVVIAGYYLMSQSPRGKAWLEDNLPVALIDSTAKQVATGIEQQLEHLPSDLKKQAQQLTRLQDRVSFLEDRVQALTMKANGHKVAGNTLVDGSTEQELPVSDKPVGTVTHQHQTGEQRQASGATLSGAERRIRQQQRLQQIADKMNLASVTTP